MDTTGYIPTVLSFCTGYAGIERGLELAGVEHRVLAFVEIEAFAIANLVKKMEDGALEPAPIYTNLKTFPAGLFRGAVDLVTGGYPCQPFSAAGKRQGSADPRHLWPYISEAIGIIRPGRVFFENVEGHISLGLNEVISDLEARGYYTTWGIFSAAEVGAPHQRKRVYIMANAEGQRYGTGREQQDIHQEDGGSVGECFSESTVAGSCVELADSKSKQDNIRKPTNMAETSSRGKCGNATVDFGGSNGDSRFSTVADTQRPRGSAGVSGSERPDEKRQSGIAAYSDSEQRGGQAGMHWPPEPSVGQLAHGTTSRLDRIRRLGINANERWLQIPCEKDAEACLRELRKYTKALCPPHRSGLDEQQPFKYTDALQFLSHVGAPPSGGHPDSEAETPMSALRQNIVSAGVVFDASDAPETLWESLADAEKAWIAMATCHGCNWESIPIGRVTTECPNRVDRIRLLGNGVVPQTAAKAWQVLDEELLND